LAKAPKLVVAAPHHHAGKVKQGSTVKHLFILKNKGNEVLNIKRAKGS